MHKVSFLLLIVGGLNWLLVGLFNWDVGALLGGMEATASRVIYILVGLSALYEIFTHKGRCKNCDSGMKMKNVEGGMGVGKNM